MVLGRLTTTFPGVQEGPGALRTLLQSTLYVSIFFFMITTHFPDWNPKVGHHFFQSFLMHEWSAGLPNPRGAGAGSSHPPQPHYVARSDAVVVIMLLPLPHLHTYLQKEMRGWVLNKIWLVSVQYSCLLELLGSTKFILNHDIHVTCSLTLSWQKIDSG